MPEKKEISIANSGLKVVVRSYQKPKGGYNLILHETVSFTVLHALEGRYETYILLELLSLLFVPFLPGGGGSKYMIPYLLLLHIKVVGFL